VCLSSRQGACGPHDTYGSALTAQPGWSQGRPDNNTSSQLIKYFGLPTSRAPDTPVPVSPGYSRRANDFTPPVVPKKSMPDNNIIEADHGAIKRVIRPTRGSQTMKTAAVTLNHAHDLPRSLHPAETSGDRRSPSRESTLRSCSLNDPFDEVRHALLKLLQRRQIAVRCVRVVSLFP
jgi:hypothetical protein